MSETQTFSYTDGVQITTIATTGYYQITAEGAAGGAGVSAAGGEGAEVTGNFYLTAGEQLEIVVGGKGDAGSAHSGLYAGGGGGGSFVFDVGPGSTLTPLVVAGGGGGGAYAVSNGENGETTSTGGIGINLGGAGGANDAGGAGGGTGGGGGGGYTGGTVGTPYNPTYGGSGTITNFAGGIGIGDFNNGGYGGGGGGGYNGGGGGGGYGGGGGGGGGNFTTGAGDGGGGGGGSYDAGTKVVFNAALNTGNGVVDLTALITCFAAGTRIRTPEGEVEVEALREGDLVLTANGAKPVRWLGRSDVSATFADPLKAAPIRIAAGALGGNLPLRDLRVSPAHAVFIDGLLVQAAALVNGASIVRESLVEDFAYYHVELDSHELLFSEGLPSESFVDNVGRMNFSNWAERTLPDAPIEELPYPRVKSARQLPLGLRQSLAA